MINKILFKVREGDGGIWIETFDPEAGGRAAMWLTKDQAHHLAMSLEGHYQGIRDAEPIEEDQDPAGVGPPRGVLREGGLGQPDEPVSGSG